jgi:hypothetical protein
MATNHSEHGEILTPVEARQGLISGRVRLVLLTSIVLVIVAASANPIVFIL